jgi:hypothetical protein
MLGMMQAPNTGVAGEDHGNRTAKKREFCYLVKFYDEYGTLLCAEPYTVCEEDSDHAFDVVERQVSKDCNLHDYFDAEIRLEDVC